MFNLQEEGEYILVNKNKIEVFLREIELFYEDLSNFMDKEKYPIITVKECTSNITANNNFKKS